MRHQLKLTTQEKISRWLELCDFTYELMEKTLTQEELQARLNRLRQDHLAKNYRILQGLAKLK